MAERKETCSACGGSGKFIGDPNNPCYQCNGHGYIIIQYDDNSGSSSSSSYSGGGGSRNNPARAANEVIGKYNEAYREYAAQNDRKAADAFAHVVNTMRDPEWPAYVDRINGLTDEFQKDFKQLDDEFNSLCFHAGHCYSHGGDKCKEEGDFDEAFKYKYTAIRYYSYSSEHQELLESTIKCLFYLHEARGNKYKDNGDTDAANLEYQRAVNIAYPDALDELEKRGITLKPTVETINKHAREVYDKEHYAVAAHLWKKTADMEDAVGQCNLGFLYDRGWGVPQNYAKSFELTSKAAAQGDIVSLNNLGVCYRDGNGVKQNYKKAKECFKQAAAQGNGLAKENLVKLKKQMAEKGPVLFGILGAFILGVIGYSIVAGLSGFLLGWLFRGIRTLGGIAGLGIGGFLGFSIGRSISGGIIGKIVVGALAVIVGINSVSKLPNLFSSKSAATQTTTATVNANVNFRTGPSTDNTIIRQLKQGDTVTLTGETSGGWTQVSHNGDTGWVSAEFLTQGAAQQSASGSQNSGQTAQAPASQASAGSTSTGSASVGNTAVIQNGTSIFTFSPRIQVEQNGQKQDLYLDRIEVEGRNFSVFYTGSATGRGGDGWYYPFWNQTVRLTNLDNPSQTWPATDQGEDDDAGGTGGFYNTFQSVSAKRFSIAGGDSFLFAEVVLPEMPD